MHILLSSYRRRALLLLAAGALAITPARAQAATGNLLTNLSITHKYDADLRSHHEVGETAHASPHHQVARWRIFSPG